MKSSRLLVLLALLGACGQPPRPAADPAPAPLAWTGPADSAAAAALASCRGPDRRCVERALYGVLETDGVAAAMAALERVLVRAPGLTPDAHGFAHGLGIAAYRSPETLASTFASCPPTQLSGCYHGVIQGYFLSLKRAGQPVSGATLDAACAPHRADAALYFQCAHGLGHGVMAIESHHLPRALDRCASSAEVFIRESCYGGAFMENIVAATHPHHTAEAHAQLGGPAAADEHAGHGAAGQGEHAEHAPPAQGEHAEHGQDEHAGHDAAPADSARHPERWVALRPSDLLYPCTVVGERFQASCYDMQSSAAIALTWGNVRTVARACARAPEAFVRRCYTSLGRDVSALAEMDHRRAVELCARAGEEAEVWCLAGVASTMNNRSNNPADAVAFCRDVPVGEGKQECYRVVGRTVLTATTERREALCATAEPAYTAECRAAAGLAARTDD